MAQRRLSGESSTKSVPLPALLTPAAASGPFPVLLAFCLSRCRKRGKEAIENPQREVTMDLLQQARQQAHYSAPATTLICPLTPNLSKCGERLSQSERQALSKSPRTGTATPYFPGSVWAFCGFVGLEYHPPFPSLLSEILPIISQSRSGSSVKPPPTTLTGSGVLCLGFTMESSGII